MAKQVLLLVGTHKGAFTLRSDRNREKWELDGPYMAGTPVEYIVADTRKKPTLYASTTSTHFGPCIHVSKDAGRTWKPLPNNPRFDKKRNHTVERIWVIQPGGDDQPGTLHVGVDPATMFTSHDSGDSWEEVRSLTDHSTRKKWQPGFGGMCLHTILPHPTDSKKMFVAISAAGVFFTQDGGKTWKARCSGIRADFLPNKHPEVGQCVHKIDAHPQAPNTLFLQNHGGVYRSDNGGQKWEPIEAGLPAVFGFPLLVHPRHPKTVYIIPLVSDAQRFTPNGKPTVYRSEDAGKSWEPLRKGLPARGAWLNVLRQALATDGLDPAGVYFGTSTGQLFGSRDDGDAWKKVADCLPPIHSVRACVL